MDKKTGDDNLVFRVRALRKEQGLTQQDLADRTGLKLPTIRALEQGRHFGRKSTLSKIAEALGTTEAFLIYGKTLSGEISEISENENVRIWLNVDNLNKISEGTKRIIAAIIKDELTREEES